jgi:glycosyltransferase involved in cell wall biosynthesis
MELRAGTLAPSRQDDMEGYELVVNTHADILPYFLPEKPGRAYVTYCHFPVAADYAAQQDANYLKIFVDLGLVDRKIMDAAGTAPFWRSFLEYYLLMLQGSHVVTNSQFSSQAIARWVKGGMAAPAVIAPPVGVEEFRRAATFAGARDDTVLVVSRINRSKKLENAIMLARILKRQGTGSKMIIAGNLSPDDLPCRAYYLQLAGMIERYELADYVDIMLNVELSRLWSLMRTAKAYFHPLEEEPFGISVVEAMSAGLVPVVPDVGGPTEFVPWQYQYRSLEEAAGIVRAALAAGEATRLQLSDSVAQFSSSAYIRRFQEYVAEKLAIGPSAIATHKGRIADSVQA